MPDTPPPGSGETDPADPLSELRHDLRGHLSSIRVAARFLAKLAIRTGFEASDPRIAPFFALIEREVLACDGKLGARPGPGTAPGGGPEAP